MKIIKSADKSKSSEKLEFNILDMSSLIAWVAWVTARILLHCWFEPWDITMFSASYLWHVLPTYALWRAFWHKWTVAWSSINAIYEYLQHGWQLSWTWDMNDVYIWIASSSLWAISHYYEKYKSEKSLSE